MVSRVKICGITEEVALEAALDHGADFVGFVFFGKSPRNVAPAVARSLCERTNKRATTVALMVDPDDATVEQISSFVKPDAIQLHGSETPDRCRSIRELIGCQIIKAIKVETAADIASGAVYRDVVDLILYDAKAPKDLADALPGGNGLTFDWRLLSGVSKDHHYMLSGGLTPENVSAAVQLTNAFAVDVSSGVESRPGVKDPRLIAAFLAAAKAAC